MKAAFYCPDVRREFSRAEGSIHRHTDRCFGFLLAAEWVLLTVLAFAVAPGAWADQGGNLDAPLWAAGMLGALFIVYPAYLAFTASGESKTRLVVAVAQMLVAALVIHLCGGRVEAHFMVFASFAFLAFYRDYAVFFAAMAVVFLDHAIRGIYWPESIYGSASPSLWLAAKHASWTALFVAGLLVGVRQSRASAWKSAMRYVQLQSAHREMEEMAAGRKAELEETGRQFDAFAHTVSHDLSAPLRSISGFCQVLLEEHDASLGSDGQGYARKVVAATDRMRCMLDSLLEYSRAARAEMPLGPVQVGDAAQEALRLLDQEVADSGATVVLKDLGFAVVAHRASLIQVLYNLLGNSLKFVPPHQRPEVVVRAEATGDRVRIWIEDNGIGIEPHCQGRIFGIFQRLDPAYRGSGMGLTLVEKAVQRMQGEIGLESAPGKGSRFWIQLPESMVQMLSPEVDARAVQVS